MPPAPSLLSLLRDCAGQEEPPAQSPLHPNPLQLLLLPWPLGAACGDGDNAWSVPTHPSRVPAGLGTQLALLWQQPEVSECHHLLLNPCSSQCSAACPTAEPSGYHAGWPGGPAVLPVPGSQLRDKGHPVGLSLVLGLDAHPIPLLGCPHPALLDASAGLIWAISPLDPTLPCGSGATSAVVGAVLPAWGAQIPLDAAVGLELCMEWESTEQGCPHAVLSPRRAVPTSPPSSGPTHACGAPRAPRHQQDL